MENDENTQVCNRTQVSNEESNANCENINTEKEKLTICNQNTELSNAIPDVNLNRNRLLIKKQESRRNDYNQKRARRKRIELIRREETPGLCSDSSMATSADLPF